MSKRSEEAALRLYPESSGPIERSIFEDRRVTLACRRACEKGYEQAEKDLALTWEDLQTINDLFYKVDSENFAAWDYEVIEQDLPFPYGQKFYEEVLRRFREIKDK